MSRPLSFPLLIQSVLITNNADTHQNFVRENIPICVNGYCSRVGGKVRGWVKLCTCLMGGIAN